MQRDAEIVGRRIARTEKLEFVLHGVDGVVRDRVSYGGDTSHLPATRALEAWPLRYVAGLAEQ